MSRLWYFAPNLSHSNLSFSHPWNFNKCTQKYWQQPVLSVFLGKTHNCFFFEQKVNSVDWCGKQIHIWTKQISSNFLFIVNMKYARKIPRDISEPIVLRVIFFTLLYFCKDRTKETDSWYNVADELKLIWSKHIFWSVKDVEVWRKRKKVIKTFRTNRLTNSYLFD